MPFLFNDYTLPIGDLIRSHGLSFHIYADANDNYISFKPEDCDQNLVKLRNFLMLNDDKTLFAIFVTPQQCAKLGPFQIEVGENVVGLSKEVKNLGVIFDQHLNFKSHIMAISKGAYFQLYNIQKIHSNPTKKQRRQQFMLL